MCSKTSCTVDICQNDLLNTLSGTCGGSDVACTRIVWVEMCVVCVCMCVCVCVCVCVVCVYMYVCCLKQSNYRMQTAVQQCRNENMSTRNYITDLEFIFKAGKVCCVYDILLKLS